MALAALGTAVTLRALAAGGLAVLFGGLPAAMAWSPPAGVAEVAPPAATATGRNASTDVVAIAAGSLADRLAPAGDPGDRRDCTVIENPPAETKPEVPVRESLPWGPLLLAAVALNVVGSIVFTLFRHSREH